MQLSIRNLSKTYPNGVQALKGVSLTFPAGVFGLLGPSGAGKSTLLRILATRQDADAGSAMLGNLDVLRQKDAVFQRLGYLPQEPCAYPNVTAQDLLAHFALLRGMARHGQRRALVEALLQQVDLWDARRQKLGAYSVSMRQRFSMAVALLGDPQLLILDEPTAGLDHAERRRFLGLLGMSSRERVVIMSAEIGEDISEHCTRMAIIDRGRIVLEGEPQAAFDALHGRTWRRTMATPEQPASGLHSRP